MFQHREKCSTLGLGHLRLCLRLRLHPAPSGLKAFVHGWGCPACFEGLHYGCCRVYGRSMYSLPVLPQLVSSKQISPAWPWHSTAPTVHPAQITAGRRAITTTLAGSVPGAWRLTSRAQPNCSQMSSGDYCFLPHVIEFVKPRVSGRCIGRVAGCLCVVGFSMWLLAKASRGSKFPLAAASISSAGFQGWKIRGTHILQSDRHRRNFRKDASRSRAQCPAPCRLLSLVPSA